MIRASKKWSSRLLRKTPSERLKLGAGENDRSRLPSLLGETCSDSNDSKIEEA
jgi:hypothetical protein